jgi:hypothetical protein
MLTVALPLLRAAAAELKLPVESVTFPVGSGSPVGATLAAIVTCSGCDWACAQVMVGEDGVTAMTGATTSTEFVPEDGL